MCIRDSLWIVQKYNGFSNRKVVELYQRYIQTIVYRYHDRVKYWISFCEINVMNSALYMVGGTVLQPHQDREAVLHQCAYPVSYTHLDVYKRQFFCCMVTYSPFGG